MAPIEENFDYLAIKINWNDATWILTSNILNYHFLNYSCSLFRLLYHFYHANWLQSFAIGLCPP